MTQNARTRAPERQEKRRSIEKQSATGHFGRDESHGYDAPLLTAQRTSTYGLATPAQREAHGTPAPAPAHQHTHQQQGGRPQQRDTSSRPHQHDITHTTHHNREIGCVISWLCGLFGMRFICCFVVFFFAFVNLRLQRTRDGPVFPLFF